MGAVVGKNDSEDEAEKERRQQARKKRRKLTWQQTIQLERKQSLLVEETSRQRRAKRLKKLFTIDYSDSEDEPDNFWR